MAEYIELNELQKFCRKYTEVDAVGLILANRTDLLHTADVIERFKIDKAIEEIDNLDLNRVAMEYEDRFYGFQLEVIEILKRNIGE